MAITCDGGGKALLQGFHRVAKWRALAPYGVLVNLSEHDPLRRRRSTFDGFDG